MNVFIIELLKEFILLGEKKIFIFGEKGRMNCLILIVRFVNCEESKILLKGFFESSKFNQ